MDNYSAAVENGKKKKGGVFENIAFLIFTSLGLILLGQLLGTLLTAIFCGAFPQLGNDPAAVAATSYSPFVGIWILALIYFACFKRTRPLFKAISCKVKGNNVKLLLLGLVVGLGLNLLCAFAAVLNGDIALRFDSVRVGALLIVFVFVFIQSAAEELLCRCYMFQPLLKRYGFMTAAIVNSVAFALLHIFNPGITVLALLNIALFGFLASAVVYYWDSLWAAFAIHAAWNFCQNIILGLPNSGMPSAFSVYKLDAAAATNSFAYDVSFGIEGTVMACAVLLAASIAIVALGRKKNAKPTEIYDV